MLKITSKDNKLVKSVKKLLDDKKYRDSTNLFIAESYRVVDSLIKNKLSIRNLIVANDSKYFQLSKEYEKNGIDVICMPNSIFSTLSSLSTSDGLIGIFNKPKNDFNLTKTGKYIVLDKIQNPGNLGSIIRTAVGFELNGIVISNDSVDLYNPNIIRATMGSCFSIPIKVVTSLIDVINQFKHEGIKVYATALSSSASKLSDVTFNPTGVAVIFGNEGNGLKDTILKICDEVVYIPINPIIDSLNVAVAAGIILYQICKQS
jgi:TrmH family RNA methyltransferase